MSNSTLVDCVVKSPNNSGIRTQKISRITPHCVVGELSAQSIGNLFISSTVKASCNYGIGKEGKIVLCVDEDARSWCSSNADNDQKAVTIECASGLTHPYTIKPIVYDKLVQLCYDICKRNNITKLIWISDKETALQYTPNYDECLLTVHRWFANKACPGDYLYSQLPNLALTVTEMLNHKLAYNTAIWYRVQVGAFKVKNNAEKLKNELNKVGYNAAYIVEKNGYYKVQVGAFSVKSNAVNLGNKLLELGYQVYITSE